VAKSTAAHADGEVRLLGALDDVRPAFQHADVLLMPSRTEPFGRVAVEAMSAGIPVIGSKVGGLADVLARSSANVRVEDVHARAFAQALVDFSRRRPAPGVESELVEAASYYSIERTTQAVASILEAAAR
jgi:glycosyltransferase involved in cell wall biosynthesis